MKVFKFLLTLAAFVLLPCAVYAEEGVILLLKSGKTVGFAFQDKPTICPRSTLIITSQTGEKVEYDYKDVQRFYWGDVQASSGIKQVKNGSVVFHLNDNGIKAEGLLKGERVSVYTVDGKIIASASSDSGQVLIPLFSSAKVFIVRTSTGITYKFVKR